MEQDTDFLDSEVSLFRRIEFRLPGKTEDYYFSFTPDPEVRFELFWEEEVTEEGETFSQSFRMSLPDLEEELKKIDFPLKITFDEVMEAREAFRKFGLVLKNRNSPKEG